MIIIPEVIILETLKSILNYIRIDFKNQTDKTKSYLYRILGQLYMERYKLYDQAVKVFVGDDDDPRSVDCHLFFNLEKASIISVHITLPNEMQEAGGLGLDQGFQNNELGSDDNKYRITYSRRFGSTYNLVITSDNPNEVIIVYHFLRAILIPVQNHFNMMGLEQIKLGGGDLNIDPRLLPPNIFVRAINVGFAYDVNVADIFDKDVVQKLVFDQIVLKPEEKTSDKVYSTIEIEKDESS